MLLTLSSTGLLYAACVALYHAHHPGRSRPEGLRNAAAPPWMLRAAALGMISAALALLASEIGWERAVPVTLGVLGGGGILCVLAAVFTPATHVAGGALLLAIGTLAGIAVLLTG